MNVKDFAREADIEYEEAKAILEEVFNIIPLTENYVIPEEISEKIQKDFIYNNQNLMKKLQEISEDDSIPTITTQLNNADIIGYFLEKKFTVFIDANFIYDENFVKFISSVEDVLKEKKAQFVVLLDVKNEIKKHTNRKSKIKMLAKSRLDIMNRYVKKGIFKIQREADIRKICKGDLADFTFQIVFQVYRRNNKNAMLITNDKNLTLDILMFNIISSVDSDAELRVGRIDDNGTLIMRKLKPKK